MENRLAKFEKLVDKKPSGFVSKFAAYKKNKRWLDKSSEIAVNVLEALRDKKLSQKDLAERLEISAQQVSKIIKGQQNLTLETISKIEGVLDISLIKINEYKIADEIIVNAATSIKVGKQSTETLITKADTNHSQELAIRQLSKNSSSMTVVYKAEEKYPIAV
nr:helix-turn-helix transcriptional regulator [uncultured Flavobacterium sp.]